MNRFLLHSSAVAFAFLAGCKATTLNSSAPNSLGTVPTPTTTPTAPSNTSLVSPTIAQTYNTFSANQRFTLSGEVLPDVTVAQLPDGSYPQANTGFTLGLPPSGETIKQNSVVTNGVYYEGSQPQGSSNSVTINFNPRDAVYTVAANTASIDANTRFQDPAHRTAFQQQLVPTLSNYRYTEAGSGTVNTDGVNQRNFDQTVSTLFVRDVGTGPGQTQYVTLAGYVRQIYREGEVTRSSTNTTQTIGVDFAADISRSVFAYGINTADRNVPRSGAATYTGDFYLHAIITPQLLPIHDDFRTIVGTSTTAVDFSAGTVGLQLSGSVVGFANDTRVFTANGSANFFKAVNDTDASRFVGKIDSWSFGYAGAAPSGAIGATYNTASNPNSIAIPTAASSIEGGFFGPNANEIGGGFRVVGQRTDERIDFLGAFAGKRN